MSETKPKAPQPASRYTVIFPARLVPILADWATSPVHFPFGRSFEGIQIEQSPDGGVDLMTTDGAAMLWVHYPPETCEAKGDADAYPVYLDLPRGLVKACREPEGPPMFDCNGDRIRYQMPKWMRPGVVWIMHTPYPDEEEKHLVLVGPSRKDELEMPEGMEDAGHYSCGQKPPHRSKPGPPWRAAFEKYQEAAAVPTASVDLQPAFLGRFKRIAKLLNMRVRLSLFGSGEPVLASLVHHIDDPYLHPESPTVKALIMPMMQEATSTEPAFKSPECEPAA